MLRRRKQLLCLLTALCALITVPPDVARAATVAPPFRDYYDHHAGERVLGPPITGLVSGGIWAEQYFEKGRIEDHHAAEPDPHWGIMYGRLTAELIERDPGWFVNGTNMTYAMLSEAAAWQQRHAPPAGCSRGTCTVQGVIHAPGLGGDGVFVPYDGQLRFAPGSYVPLAFWTYITRHDYFPGGWLHDIGLPMTDPLTVTTTKNGEPRTITMQAFERTVLTFDPLNPPEWQIERGNLGSDMLRSGGPTAVNDIEQPDMNDRVTFPFPIIAHVGRPGDQITATISWGQGPQFINTFTALPSASPNDQRGLVIGLLDWVARQPPPVTHAATIELRDAGGITLAWRSITILGPNDPDTATVNLFWMFGPNVRPHPQQVLVGESIEAAALEALLWGPPRTQMSYTTALPTPQEILTSSDRDASWGARVMLRQLNIENGVATVDLSREFRVSARNPARITLIREQIAQTLTQFPTIREVQILVEGQIGSGFNP